MKRPGDVVLRSLRRQQFLQGKGIADRMSFGIGVEVGIYNESLLRRRSPALAKLEYVHLAFGQLSAERPQSLDISLPARGQLVQHRPQPGPQSSSAREKSLQRLGRVT